MSLSGRCTNCNKCFDRLDLHFSFKPMCKEVYVSINDSGVEHTGMCPPQPAEQVGLLKEVQQQDMLEALAKMRYDRMLNESDIASAKELARVAANNMRDQITEALRMQKDERAQLLQQINDPFDGIDTKKQEFTKQAAMYPYVCPRQVQLSANKRDIVVSLPLDKLIIRQLQHDAKFRTAVLEKSEEWKRGDGWRRPGSSYGSIDDGCIARCHPHLMRPATQEEERDVRMAYIVYVDEVEVRRPQPPATSVSPIHSTCLMIFYHVCHRHATRCPTRRACTNWRRGRWQPRTCPRTSASSTTRSYCTAL